MDPLLGRGASIVTYICGLWPPGAVGARQLIEFDRVCVVFRHETRMLRLCPSSSEPYVVSETLRPRFISAAMKD